MAEATDSGLARRLVTLFDQRCTVEFAQIAKTVTYDSAVRDTIQSGLLEIAKAERAFEDIRTRVSAIKVIELLGFSNSVDVRRELFRLFTTIFSGEKLAELAAFEALPKTRRCGAQCSEMRLLRSLLRGLLRVREEPGLTAGRLVVEAFDGTEFARKVAALLGEPSMQ
jgi:hypothetical protein